MDLICIGKLVNTHGIKGEVRIISDFKYKDTVFKIDNIIYIKVKSTEDVVGKLATIFYGDPTSKLQLVGVTGTNGKTTIATLLYKMFRKFGYKVGLISTVCNYIDD